MARISRPPGFDMTYRPKQSVAFGPPLRSRVLSMAYLGVAIGLVVFVIVGSLSASGTWMFHYVVEQDDSRILGARALAAIVLVSAVASVIRSRMRGVVVHPEGLETRDILGLGWPRVRRYAWPQIDKIVLDAGGSIVLLLWDGTREILPDVRARTDLADMLERVARARAIPVTGARGAIDVEPDLED
jgi:hypothetical protein